MLLNFFLVILSILIINVDTANILGIFHFPMKSHHILGSALFKKLAKRGHNVTMVSPFPLKEPIPNYTDIALTSFTEDKDEFLKTVDEERSFIKILSHAVNLFTQSTLKVLNDKPFQEFLKSDSRFDVVITFALLGEPFVAVGHHFNAPVICFSPVGNSPPINYYSGNVAPPSFVPIGMLSLTEDMTFFQRVANTLATATVNLFNKFIVYPKQQEMVKQAFPNAPPLEELLENISLYLVNSHYSSEGIKPYLSNMFQIGGFHLQEKEDLPEDLKKYLDDAKEGVVYFSLGSNMKSSHLGDQKINAITAAFAKLPLKVLWKFETDLPGTPKNVKILSWVPQKTVLAHPNIKLFITHGGFGGITEATYYGVPMVAIPIFGDQGKNVADCELKGLCVKVDFKTFGEKEIWHAVQEVLSNPKYSENAKKSSDLIQNQPINPMDHAVFWVEHVAKHKSTAHFKTVAAKLPFYKFYILDVIVFLLVVAFILAFISICIVKAFLSCICGRKNTEKIKKN